MASEDIAQYNQQSLNALAWAVRAGHGQFFLKFAHCNYLGLQQQLAKQLQQLCKEKYNLTVSELNLSPKDTNLFSKIQTIYTDEKPEALTILGLESVSAIEQLLEATNQVREEFEKHCPFTIILWVNQAIFLEIQRLAPDLKNWGTPVFFMIEPEVLWQTLQQEEQQFYKTLLALEPGKFITNTTLWGTNYQQELEAALEDLEKAGWHLSPELDASLEFVLGRDAYSQGKLDTAFQRYQKSLAGIQKARNNSQDFHLLLKEATLYYHIALCYCYQAEAGEFVQWLKAKSNFQNCLQIFKQLSRKDLEARFINCLGEVLLLLEDWEGLKQITKESILLQKTYGDSVRLAQTYGLIAEINLKESDLEEALLNVQKALNFLEKAPTDWQYYKSFYLLILSQIHKRLNQDNFSTQYQKEAAKFASINYPQSYLRLLRDLRQLYLDCQDYLNAYRIKQEQRRFKQKAGLTAFVGPIRLENLESIQAFGREDDIEHLVNNLANPERKLTVVIGQSGVGKSSLLEAGLVPKLHQKQFLNNRQILPILQRVYPRSGWAKELGKNLINQLRQKKLTQYIDPNLLALVEQAQTTDERSMQESVVRQLTINESANLYTFIIFDQFEEFFFTFHQVKQRRQFFEFLENCLQILYVKVLLCLREDYIHFILSSATKVNLKAINNNILDNKNLYIIENFTPEQAFQVIDELSKRSRFFLETNLIHQLVKDLVFNEDQKVRPIELQVVGAQLQEKNIRNLTDYQALGKNPKDNLVREYLNSVIDDCGQENKYLAQLVLHLLTDENIIRPIKTLEDLEKSLKSQIDLEEDLQMLAEELVPTKHTLSLSSLSLVLKIFVRSGLVFIVQERQKDYYQLVHDYVAQLIRQDQGTKLQMDIENLKQDKKRLTEKLTCQNRLLENQQKILKSKNKQLSKANLLAWFTGILIIPFVILWVSWQQVKTQAVKASIEVANVRYHSNRDSLESLLAVLNARESLKCRIIWKDCWFWQKEQAILQVTEAMRATLYGVDEFREYNRLEHNRPVTSVDFSGDDKIVSVSYDNSIKLWDSSRKQLQEKKFYDSSERITQVQFLPDNRILGIVKFNSAELNSSIKLRVLNSNTLNPVLEDKLIKHSQTINAFDVNLTNLLMATVSQDKTLKLWSLEGKQIREISLNRPVNTIRFNPNGQQLAIADDEKVKLLTLNGTELISFNHEHSKKINQISFAPVSISPHGLILATASDDKMVKLWTLEGKNIQTLEGHDDAVTQVSFNQNGTMMATASSDRTIKLWQFNEQTKQFQLLKTLIGHDNSILDLKFSPDGQTLASAGLDNTVKLWRSNQKIYQKSEIYHNNIHQGFIYQVRFSPDGKKIATASADGTVKVWSRDGQLLQTIAAFSVNLSLAFPQGAFSVNFSPDSTLLAIGGTDSEGKKAVILWRVEGDKVKDLVWNKNQSPQQEIWDVTFSPDGKIIAASYDNRTQLWNQDGNPIGTLDGHQDLVRSISFSPNGRTIATASRDNTIKLWKQQEQSWQEVKTLKGHIDNLTSVSFSPDGNALVSTSFDKTAILWFLDGRAPIVLHENKDKYTHPDGRVTSASFSPNDKIIATASADKTIKLWSQSGKQLYTLQGHTDIVNSLSFSSDGQVLASVDGRGRMILWNLARIDRLDELVKLGCKWGKDYLKNSAEITPENKQLCEI